MKVFDIWTAGLGSGCARALCWATATGGRNFKDACVRYAKENSNFERFFKPKKMTYFGYKLFDNEEDARKSFG